MLFKLAKFFQDNMVIQCDDVIKVWGTATPGTEICVTVSKGAVIAREGKAIAGQEGNFTVKLSGIHASFTQYTITAMAGSERQYVEGVLFGDVFLFAGQSNMEYPVWAMENSEELTGDFTGAKYIRTFKFVTDYKENVPYIRPYHPQDEIRDGNYWHIPAADNIENFSGFGYMIAKNMARKLNKPIGAIDTSFGGIPLCSYLPLTCANDPRLSGYRYKLSYTEEEYNTSGVMNLHQTGGIYNEVISPLKNVSVKALVWYQGESEVMGGFPEAYTDALSVLHETFNKNFGKELPLFVMDIANCRYNLENGVNMLNIAIAKWGKGDGKYFTTQYDIPPHYIGTRDFSDYGPIHPTNKQPLADRASEMIYENVYCGRNINPPVFESYEIFKNRLTVRFKVSAPLSDGKIFGLYIIDSAGRPYMLDAQVSGPDTVSASVKGHKVSCVSYAYFINNLPCNLKDTNGLPASPFTTSPDFSYSPVIPFYCVSDSVLSCNFVHDFGGNYLKPSWKNGIIFGEKGTKVTVKNGVPTAYHVPVFDQYWYFSLSPELFTECSPVDLSKYSKITVKIYSSDISTHYTGMHFRKNGKTYCVSKPNGYNCGVDLKKGVNTVTFDLIPLNAFNAPQDKALLSDIYDIQFTFKDKNKGFVRIMGVSLT